MKEVYQDAYHKSSNGTGLSRMKWFLYRRMNTGEIGYDHRSAVTGYWHRLLLSLCILLVFAGPAAAAAPVAHFTSIAPGGNYPAFLVKFTDTSVNTPTSWTWTFTNVAGNNTPVIFSSIQNPTLLLTTNGNYSIRLTCSNDDGSDWTIPVFFNISDCNGGTSCNRRFYPTSDGSLINTTPGTWAGTRNAVAGTGRWEGADYNPIQIAASTTPGRYLNMHKMLTTFDTTAIPYNRAIQNVNVTYWGYSKYSGMGSFNISLIDANPANPASYAVGDWSKTSYQRQAV